MQSLLEILNRERDLVHEIRTHEDSIRLFENRIAQIQKIDIDCESKQRDLDLYNSAIDEARGWMVLNNIDLETVRNELRSYIKTLFEEET